VTKKDKDIEEDPIEDPEVLAIAIIVDTIEGLEGDARQRVANYLVERYVGA
jgi:hypothetical protein